MILKIFLSVFLVAASSWVRAEAPLPVDVSSRVAFLKLIDRPRVEASVEERELPAPAAGMEARHIVFSSEADQRVPVLILKPSGLEAGRRVPGGILLPRARGEKGGGPGGV